MSINRVNISGNLTFDPEYRVTDGGTKILTFSVAVNDRVKDSQTDEWKDYPNYIPCKCFGNRAEGLSKVLRKGLKVALEGKLHYSSWETDDGQRRSRLEVNVDTVEFMTRASNSYQQPQTQYQPQQPTQAVQPETFQVSTPPEVPTDYSPTDCPF